MKYLVASDIHGSAYYCDLMLKAFRDEKCDRLFLLGDILYHGPRNDLPKDYSPKRVIEMLSEVAGKTFCVRGNCDTEVDQMVLPFPIMADYALIDCRSYMMYATHGHIYNSHNPPPITPHDVLLYGHTHVPEWGEGEKCIWLNPGSVSLPKQGSRHSCMILEKGYFHWKDIETGEYFLPSVQESQR